MTHFPTVRRLGALVLAAGMLLPAVPSSAQAPPAPAAGQVVVAQQSAEVYRFAGASRYDTAAQIAAGHWQVATGKVVLLVEDRGWEAPLVMGALATNTQRLDAGTHVAMLPVPPDGTLPQVYRELLTTSRVSGVVLVGGETYLSQLAPRVQRMFEEAGQSPVVSQSTLASDPEQMSVQSLGDSDVVMLATTNSFADALTSGPLAFNGGPLMLTRPDRLNPHLAERLGQVEQVTIIGGTAAVSQAVEDDITSRGITVVRLAGSSRYETALTIARAMRAIGITDPNTGTDVYIGAARADNYVDASAAAPYAHSIGAPILLVDPQRFPSELAGRVADVTTCEGVTLIYGGTSAVSDTVAEQFNASRC